MSRVSRLRSDLRLAHNSSEAFDRIFGGRPPVTLIEASPVAQFDPLTLTTLQQAALMRMRDSHVSRAVYRRLLEDSQDTPSTPDFHALRDQDLCEWAGGKRMHQFCGGGAGAAMMLERALCKRFGIHLVQFSSADTWQQMATCSCGAWSKSFQRDSNSTTDLHRSHANHVASVTGVETIRVALKPPGMVGA